MRKNTLEELLKDFKQQYNISDIFFRLDDFGKNTKAGEQDSFTINFGKGGFKYMCDTIKIAKGSNIFTILSDIIIANRKDIIVNIINVGIIDKQYFIYYSIFNWEF